MKIMLDSNVLISIALFKTSNMSGMLEQILSEHEIVLCDYILTETIRVTNKKFPKKINIMIDFIKNLYYEVFNLIDFDPKNYPYIKDIKDLPILANAIEAGVDIIITGDTDFDEVKIPKPTILKPRQYIDIFLSVGHAFE